MKKLSKRATDYIELFFKTSINSIKLNRHDIDVLYSHYKYSWYEFDKLDSEIQRLNNIIDKIEKALKDHKDIKVKAHYNEFYVEIDEMLEYIKELKEGD